MASPQCENGHIRIADELYEAILRAEFSKRELLVVLAVIRKTYGWSKPMDRISSSQIAELTGIAPQHCRAAMRELKTRRVIHEADNEIGIQKDYEQWGGPKQAGPKQAGKAAQNGPERRPKTGHTIDRINKIDRDPSPLPPPFAKPEREAEEPMTPSAEPKRGTWTPPTHINLDAWAEFEQHRLEIGKPLSDLARTKAANQLQALTHDEQQRCIDFSIQARWAGLFPEKVKVNGNATHRSPGQESRTERYARMQREAEQKAAASCRAAGLD